MKHAGIDHPADGKALAYVDQVTAVVAIPAKNEAERIEACLLALSCQTRRPDAVLLLLNNCTDGTAAIAGGLAGSLPFGLHIVSHAFPAAKANAGHARMVAMQYAAELAGGDGALLTTDADTIVAPDWVERSLLGLAAGADLVCGRVEIDPREGALIPAHLHADDALECELISLLDQIIFVVDPDPDDPWPRHTEAAGASLAVTVAAYQRAGGMPDVPSGEDRAFVDRLVRQDARIRHDPLLKVIVSARIEGRAPGGMADTIRRRMVRQDVYCDDKVEYPIDAFRRADFRRRLRLAWQACRCGSALPSDLAADIGIRPVALRTMLDGPYFGIAWANVEAASPLLHRRRVSFGELPRQIAYARQLLAQLETPGFWHETLPAAPDVTDWAGGRLP